MILTENSNSDIRVLVLARPADSVCAILASALRQWGYVFSVYSTVYEVVNAIEDNPVGQSAILIARPAMLGPQAASFIEQHFPNFQVIGWIDSSENISDCAIVQTTANGMIMASHLDQLQQVIHRLCKTVDRSVPDTGIPKESDRLEYELSDDEVTALLGVE